MGTVRVAHRATRFPCSVCVTPRAQAPCRASFVVEHQPGMHRFALAGVRGARAGKRMRLTPTVWMQTQYGIAGVVGHVSTKLNGRDVLSFQTGPEERKRIFR